MHGFIVTVFICQRKTGENKFGTPPNIIVIMADDMSFSDIRFYGEGLETLQLDQFVANGLRYMQFHNAARCRPSRAALIIQLCLHLAGTSWGAAGYLTTLTYAGNLNSNIITTAQVRKGVSYGIYKVGKLNLSKKLTMHSPLRIPMS